MTPFAIVGTVYLILLAICFAVSAVSLAVIAHKIKLKSSPLWVIRQQDQGFVGYTNWPKANGKSVEHGEG